jgi:hypothetical protein
MRAAPTILRLVVPQQARISVLLHDYTVVADKDEHGQLSNEWKERMIQGATSLKKRIGGEKLQRLIEQLHAGQYSEFASTALSYYDGLYDKHIKHWNSSGSQSGARAANAIDIFVDANATDVDGVVVGRQVLEMLESSRGMSQGSSGGSGSGGGSVL